MSLKTIHIFLILVSIALAAFFGVWALGNATDNFIQWLGRFSFVVSAVLCVYLFFFIKKVSKI